MNNLYHIHYITIFILNFNDVIHKTDILHIIPIICINRILFLTKQQLLINPILPF